MSILLGSLHEVFLKQATLTIGNSFFTPSIGIGDFNKDDQLDIAVTNSDTHTIGIFFGYGNISFTNQTTYSTGPNSSPSSLAIGDFNNDTRLDIVVANYGSDNVGIFISDGDGSFADQTKYLTGSSFSPYFVAVGDFNNDVALDIIVANYLTSNIVILLGYGDGTFGSVILFQMKYGSHPFFIVVGDFNNDRKLDFVVANSGTDSLEIALQTC